MVPTADSTLLALLVGFTVILPVLWTPLLVAANVRRLFIGFPTETLPLNYALGVGGFAFGNAIAVFAGLFLVTAEGGANLLVVFRTAVGVTVGLLAVAWFVVGFGLPRTGRWEPADDGVDGRVALAVGCVWYLGCSVAVFGLLSLVIFAFSFPG